MGRSKKKNKNKELHKDKILDYTPTKRLSVFLSSCINKRIILPLFLSLTFFIYFYLTKSIPLEIGGDISHFGDVGMSYASHQSKGISPLCGCYNELDSNKWRGISFIARNITVNNKPDGTSLTGYRIISSFPAPITYYPYIKLTASVYTIAMPYSDNFDPTMIITKKFPKHITYRKYDIGHEQAMYYFTEKELNISLLGEYPLSCWIPSSHSDFSIKNINSMFLNNSPTTVLEEKYYYQNEVMRKIENNEMISEDIEYPIGDFIGPNVLFWSENNSIIMKSGKKAVPTPINYIDNAFMIKNKTNKIITALIINSPFSVRMACIPYSKSGRPAILGDVYKEKIYPFVDYGTVNVFIKDPVRQGSEYEKILNIHKKGDVIWVGDVNYIDNRLGGNHTMNFRLPPAPPREGFNIFGEPSSIKFGSAIGKLMIGSSPMDIIAPSNIEFNNIKTIKTENNVIHIPFQIDTKNSTAKLLIQGTSEVIINGDKMTFILNKYKNILPITNILSGIASIISAIIAIINFTKIIPGKRN